MVRAVPANFRQTSTSDAGNGVFQFEYAWDSTSGNLSDLSDCIVFEVVIYPGPQGQQYCFPAPFPPQCVSNPTGGSNDQFAIQGPVGALGDDHSFGEFTAADFRQPYFGASFTASQSYRYQCGSGSSQVSGTLLGPLPIERSVSPSDNHTGKYTVTKPTNGLAKIDPLPE